MKLTFYGTRGTMPVCEREYQEYGGNTTCIMLTFSNGEIAIIDAGSGIRNLGKDMKLRGHGQHENIYILFTHFHWDHIQGFPFFEPAYNPKRHFTITAIGQGRSSHEIKGIFETQMQRDFFPVSLDNMGAQFLFLQSENDFLKDRGICFRAIPHNHPGGAYAYRIEEGEQSVVIATDIEHGDEIDTRLIEFATGADLLVHDAQYTPEELMRKAGWGHSSWEQALEVAQRAGVKQLALTHHDPDHNDHFLKEVETRCQQLFPNCFLARERQEILL